MSDYIREVTPDGIKSYFDNQQPIAVSTPDNPPISDPQIDETAIAQVMGIESKEMTMYEDNIQTLKAWAKKQGYQDPMELKWIIRSLQDKLGTPSLTEKWITTASRYAYLELETDRMNKERMDLIK